MMADCIDVGFEEAGEPRVGGDYISVRDLTERFRQPTPVR